MSPAPIPQPLVAGLTATIERTVTEADTAAAVGSGSLPVLGTPVLLAWSEAATCAAVESCLAEGQTTVGTRVSVEHLAPSAVGAVVRISAGTTHVDGKLVRFSVAVRQDGKLVGSGEVTRVIVDAERFMGRVAGA
ncbi:thioesterase family protein [Marmoricola sp. URHB0036]|jgi:fluoroacetyl-CoA thioesterase|uniref:thioesterase family protein n=1 Tax=Marmoricola sp. URHB0036 TaxID=1298863 RepID=UPI00041B43BD|nr:hotdog domain-containing protein [Marmoricola sp. URHB0036]